MNALAPMIRLARPPAPDSDGGFTNHTTIPVTNAAIAEADPARFRGMRPRVWPQCMPSRETVWFVPLLVVSLLVAMSLTIFLSPAIGIPLLVIAAIVGAFGWFGSNSSKTGRMEEFREQTQPDVEFTARDRETLTPSENDSTR